MQGTAQSQPDYSYWHNALAGSFGPVHDSDAQPGFYRRRVARGGNFEPVAIFVHDGEIVALVNGKPQDANDIWTFVCQYPVKEDWYHAKMRGEPWPDEDATIGKIAPMGHNRPPSDAAEVLGSQIDAASEGASQYEEISDDETASKAQSLRARLNELSRDADKKREAEKKPHLEASKVIDAKWQPLVKKAKAAADAIASALGAHETRKAREAARRAEEERKAREAAAKANAPMPPAPPPIPVPAPQTSVRGAYGRAATIKAVKVAKVVDQDAAYGYLKTHKEMIELVASLAQRAVNAGLSVPGVEIEEQRKVV